MKKVFTDTNQISHLWANKIQDEARNPSNNFFFDGDIIYSYGKHFPIATHYKDVVLFTTDSYSVTTANHINIVRQACSHIDKVYCNNPFSASKGYHTGNLESFKSRVQLILIGLDRARKPENYIEPAKYVYNQCVEYCKLFEIEIPKDITEIIESVDSGKYKEFLKKEFLRIRQENQERKNAMILKFDEDLIKWKKVEIFHLFGIWSNKIYFRLREGEIETSKGIKIPVNVALRYYNQLKANKLKVGSKILDYTVKSVDQKMLVIGCHNILVKDFEEFIKENNLQK